MPSRSALAAISKCVFKPYSGNTNKIDVVGYYIIRVYCFQFLQIRKLFSFLTHDFIF
ncbi:hypothetical protein CpB1011 [Chlamydia pneumoniae TW-183]|uniref:Uncharacterized protein n=1 Tax=Chlamydia pneumoniae TaxID=83558 RepID=A0ABN3YS06_CHLPN|nr:hypothetical protein CpB1011 [Chlamydia pneumoniae TW-183]